MAERPARLRLDRILVERGLAESRQKAQALIRAGQVRVGGERFDKPGSLCPVDSEVSVAAGSPFVSRGGEKLKGALARFDVQIEGRVCLDGGISTGGFTDCLLQRGQRGSTASTSVTARWPGNCAPTRAWYSKSAPTCAI